MSKPKVCVIVGAGASYDVWNGVGPGYGEDDSRRPPLTSQLFDSRFWDILRPYSGARVLAQELGPLAQAGTLDLERQLQAYQASDNPLIREHYKHVPPYLRDVVHSRSIPHHDAPGCYTQLSKKLLSDQPHDVLFLTTNYDDLIERSLAALDPSLQLQESDSLDQYVAPSRAAKIVKLHGSVDWFGLVARHKTAERWEDAVKAHDLAFEETDVYRLTGVHQSRAVQGVRYDEEDDNRWWVYPYITAPLAEKGSGEFRCPQGHQNTATGFLRECRKFLICGSSGLDEDLLGLLAGEVGAGDAQVQLVGGNDAFEAATRFSRSVRQFGALGDPGSVHSEGFRAYVLSEAFDRFLRASA